MWDNARYRTPRSSSSSSPTAVEVGRIVIPVMADSVAQQLYNHLNIIRRIINRKFAKILLILVTHKRAGSVGALAGFAIAILFSWKFLRVIKPGRKRKEDTCSTSSRISDSQVADDLSSPAEPLLAQVVKKKLNGGRKMTCQLLGVILEECTPEELQERATVKSSAVEVLLEICKHCDIYLMERVFDDESMERVMVALENAGLFESGCLMKEKVLFCSTQSGRSSFVRQLEPDWHVDTDPDIISQLSRFIRNQIHISRPGSSSLVLGPNIASSASLESFFA